MAKNSVRNAIVVVIVFVIVFASLMVAVLIMKTALPAAKKLISYGYHYNEIYLFCPELVGILIQSTRQPFRQSPLTPQVSFPYAVQLTELKLHIFRSAV